MAEITQSVLFKRGTKAALIAKLKGENKPKAGEPIYEIASTANSTSSLLKIGDGINDYEDLPYVGNGSSTEQIVFASRYEFPSVGSENILYVAKDEKNSYIWTGTYYELVSVDHNQIDGGGADSF